MRIGPIVIDTDNMTIEEMENMFREVSRILDRKKGARHCKEGLKDAVAEAKKHQYAFCNRYTGEVFNPNDWDVYDEKMECIHSKEID